LDNLPTLAGVIFLALGVFYTIRKFGPELAAYYGFAGTPGPDSFEVTLHVPAGSQILILTESERVILLQALAVASNAPEGPLTVGVRQLATVVRTQFHG
jgi:hypothetical protein